MSGIRDFATNTVIEGCNVTRNGRDGQAYNGDGVLLQCFGHRVSGCTVSDNGDSPTFEHGIYASSVARDYRIEGCTLRGNAAPMMRRSSPRTASSR